MKKRYLEIWKKSFRLTGSTSRNDFWLFVGISFLLSIFLKLCLVGIVDLLALDLEFIYLNTFIQIIFLVPTFTAAIRRMNDIQKPPYYLFIPYYNFYLLLQQGNVANAHAPSNRFSPKLIIGFMVGHVIILLANAFISLVFIDVIDKSTSTNTGIGILLMVICFTPISVLITVILLAVSKQEIAKSDLYTKLFYTFLISMLLILIIIYNAIR